jgi:hypothetical protein
MRYINEPHDKRQLKAENILDIRRRGQLEGILGASTTSPKREIQSTSKNNFRWSRESMWKRHAHHFPCRVLLNIPAPSCGIESTSTRRELHTKSVNAPWWVGEKADTVSVKSPSGVSSQVNGREDPARRRRHTGKLGGKVCETILVGT